MNPKRVMIDVAGSWLCLSGGTGERRARRSYERPGEAYLRLPEETRKVLAGLRSDDIKDVRVRPWYSDP